MTTTLDALRTPALVLDRAVVARNTQAMTEKFRRHRVRLRPHMKTAKTAPVARLATEGNFGGITVSTLAEAAYFLAEGYTDITYAVGIVPSKLDAVADLQRNGAAINLITDDVSVARAIGEAGRRRGVTFNVLIEVDTGQHRTGIDPEAPALLAIGRALHEGEGTHLAGVLTHAGQVYHCASADDVRNAAEEERRGITRAAERLTAAGLPCEAISAGSTPAAVLAENFDGITEFRPGNYTLFDLTQMELGACAVSDIAVSVLSTVIGHMPAHGRIAIDAGFMALSKDLSVSEFRGDVGFGWVMDEEGRLLDGLRVFDVNQEHGLINIPDATYYDRLAIGSRVRILPNHSCATAAMFDAFHVVAGGTEIAETWPRCAGW